MIIRAYAGIPATYAPDVGEIIEARRTPVDRFVRAVVLDARRNRDAHLRLKIQWLESDPNAGAPNKYNVKKPIVANTLGWIVVKDGVPPLVRQINRGTPSG